jgi:hypothetical protein
MAKSSKKPAAAAPAPAAAAKKPAGKVVAKTEVRNTPIPKVAAAAAAPKPVVKAAAKVVTHDSIALRAYEIYLSGTGGSEMDNWLRAERELRGV